MADPTRSTTAGPVSRAAAAPPPGRQRRTPGDELRSVAYRLERLARAYDRGWAHESQYLDLNEEAWAISRAVLAPFRGSRAGSADAIVTPASRPGR